MSIQISDFAYRRPASAFNALYQAMTDTLRVAEGVTEEGVKVETEGTLKAIAKKIVEPPYKGAR